MRGGGANATLSLLMVCRMRGGAAKVGSPFPAKPERGYGGIGEHGDVEASLVSVRPDREAKTLLTLLLLLKRKCRGRERDSRCSLPSSWIFSLAWAS